MAFWSGFARNAPAWFARLRGDRTGSAQDARFRRWLAADPGNIARYEHQELVWKVAGELRHDPEIERWLAGVDAAPPEFAGRAVTNRKLTLAALACALALLVIGLSVRFAHRVNPEQLYTTGIGEERTITLPDHSTMTLNTATRARVSYSGSHRSVLLEGGEATFNVVPDAARSFRVIAAGGSARALGTRFNVLCAGNRITVAVLDGRVAVSAARATDRAAAESAALVVTGGEQVTYADGRVDQPEPANIARIQGWHAGRIVLNNVELAEAVAEFNRYRRLPIRLSDPALLTHRITGVFRTGESNAFLDAVQEAFDVHVERTPTAIILK